MFRFGEARLRTSREDGRLWSVADDVCAVLEHTNTSTAVARLDDDEKGINYISTLGGEQEMLTVTESGLFHLILTSRKPEAKAFRRWVTEEVLPTIRRTGSFTSEEAGQVPVVSVTLPGPGRHIVQTREDGSVMCHPEAHEHAMERIYWAEGRLLCHTLKAIEAHWQIARQAQFIGTDAEPFPEATLLHRAIVDGGKLADKFLPHWQPEASCRKGNPGP